MKSSEIEGFFFYSSIHILHVNRKTNEKLLRITWKKNWNKFFVG